MILLLLWKRIAFLFFVSCTLFVNYVESKDEVMVVSGYMPDYRSYIDLNAASKHLTDVILFSISPKADGTLSNTCCLNNHHFQQAHNAKQSSPGKQNTYTNTHTHTIPLYIIMYICTYIFISFLYFVNHYCLLLFF